MREKSDYDDFYIAGKEETKKQLQNAQVFVTAVEKYLTENSRDWVVEKSKQYYYDKISDKNYDAELLAQGIPAKQIRHYGFAFEGKKVLIGSL